MSGTRGEPAVSVVEGLAKIPRDEWNSLLAADDSPFMDWDWLASMEESGSATRRTGWAPYHLTVRRIERGPLLAACPVYLKTHSQGEFVFDQGWAEAAENAGLKYYPKLLVGVPFTPHTGRRFLTARDADRLAMIRLLGQALASLCIDNKLSSVHVNFCEPDEAAALAELGFLERFGYQYHWQNSGFASFDDYLGALRHKRRSAIRHERKAIRDQEIDLRVFSGDAIDDSLFAPMFEIYRSTIDKLYWGRQYLTPACFDLMRQRFKRHLTFVCAFRGRQLIAGTFNVQKAGVLYGRYWGAFEELKFLHFNVCYYTAMEHCIRDGIGRFEPGAGGEYKWLRGFDPALTRSMHFIVHPGLRDAVGKFVAREKREVERWIAAGHLSSQLKAPPPSNVEPGPAGRSRG
jgi:predicted N-acyltransferase